MNSEMYIHWTFFYVMVQYTEYILFYGTNLVSLMYTGKFGSTQQLIFIVSAMSPGKNIFFQRDPLVMNAPTPQSSPQIPPPGRWLPIIHKQTDTHTHIKHSHETQSILIDPVNFHTRRETSACLPATVYLHGDPWQC